MGELRWVERILAYLRQQLAPGGTSHQAAIEIDRLISAFDSVRVAIVEDLETGRSATPPLPWTSYYSSRRGGSA